MSAEGLFRLQRAVLARVAASAPLDECLAELCRGLEELAPGSLAAVLSLGGPSAELVAPSADARLAPALDASLRGAIARRGEGSAPVLFAEGPSGGALWVRPLRWRDGRPIGALALLPGRAGEPGAGEREMLAVAGDLAHVAMVHERAAHELSEQRWLLQSVLEGTEDPIFAKDREHRFLLANSAEARGVRPDPAQMVGLTDADLYPSRISDRSHAIEREVMRTGRGQHYEEVYENPVEGQRTFLIRKSPLRDREGEVRGVIGIARDVTERKRAERAFLHAQKLDSLGVLAGGIAHDFNNLLTGILGNADRALAALPAGSEVAADLREVVRAARRAAELTDQMLAYSGKGEFVRGVLHLPTLVDDVAGLVTSSISKSARLVFEHEPDLPNVEGDAAQLRQLVMNLLINASEALEGGAGEVRVRTAAVSRGALPSEAERLPFAPHVPTEDLAPGRYVELTVEDTGVGMAPETLARIFDPFFTTKFTGRGLGLAAVLGIVRGHGGTLDVRSRPGQGTRLTVFLPATDAPLPPTRTAASSGASGRGTVLVVEDEALVRELVRGILERAGFAVLTASDGATGEQALRAAHDEVAAVLLDLTTPGISGPAAFRALRQVRPDVPIVLTSGYARADATREFGEAELAGFLKKPFVASELVERIRDAIRRAGDERAPNER